MQLGMSKKEGEKAWTKLGKKKEIVEWFEVEGRERRERDRVQKEHAEVARKKKEEQEKEQVERGK